MQVVLGGLLLLAMLLGVQYSIGWAQLLTPWLSISISTLLMASALTWLSYISRSLRVYDYFLPSTRGGLLACLRLTLLHNALNNLLPMRSGEASYPLLMQRYFQLPLLQTTASLLWFRLMDLHALGAAALWLLCSPWLPLAWVLILLGTWLALPWVLFRLRLAQRLSSLLQPRLSAKWQQRWQQAHSGWPGQAQAFWRAWFWTLFNWLVKLLTLAWVLQQFTPLSLSMALLGALGGDLTSVLPLHGIAGAGTYETGVVTALLPAQLPPAQALSAAVNLHLFVLGWSVLAAALALLIPPRWLAPMTEDV